MIGEMQSAKTLSTFQKRVLAAVATIPWGNVTTYAALAAAVNCGSPRAIGQALRKNPFSPHVPCHRVVRTDGTPGGFFGDTSATAIHNKKALLNAEGITFDPTGRVEERFVLRSLKEVPPHARPHPRETPNAAGK